MNDNYQGAFDNAKAWFEELRELYREATNDDPPMARCDEIAARVDEMPLSVECREPWHSPGEKTTPSEFNILLTTGGPALRVWGDLSEYGEPENAQLQMQDWGIPWREVWPCEVNEMDEARAVIQWFAQHFHFGG